MNKFNKLYNQIISEWVNYTPSYERTQAILSELAKKYSPEEYVYLTGEDDWSAPDLFRLNRLLSDFVVDKFQTGVSGITSNGIVINKADLPTVLKILKKSAKNPKLNGIDKYGKLWQADINQYIFNPETNAFDSKYLYKSAYTNDNFDNVEWIVFDGK